MNRILLLVIAVCALTLAGCAATPSVEVDPFSNLSPSQRPYRGLSLALVLSENTKNSIKYSEAHNRANSAIAVNTNKVFGEFGTVLERNFESVTKVDDLFQANQSGADLVGVLDVYATFPEMLKSIDARFKVALSLTAPDGRQIDILRIESVKSSLAAFRLDSAVWATNIAAQAAASKLEAALLASQPLSGFATEKTGIAATPRIADRPTTKDPVKPQLLPIFSEADRLDDYAVIIGVEGYADLPAATYAERDAAATKSFIRALGVPERNIVLLTGNRATKNGFEKTIEGWLPNNVSEKSRVFIYYSGHGAPDTKTGDAYLVPIDGDPQYLAQTGYPLKRLYSKLGQLKVQRVLIALDSCFSGAGGRSVLAKGTRPLVVSVDMAVEAQGKISVISASAGDQISGTSEDAGYGLFTYSLLQGLNGAAKDAQGRVTLESLYGYIKPRVQDNARRDNRDQTPQLQNSGENLLLRAK